MIFSSSLFLFIFLPATLLIYYIIPKKYILAKNIELLIASLIFYAWGEPKNVILMLVSIAANYLFGRLLDCDPVEKKKFRRWILVISVVFNLGLLFYFKYMNLFANLLINAGLPLSGIFSAIGIPINEAGAVNIALPIGISFFTFQIMSYTIDVFLGNVKTQKNVFNLALYISLFPQLIAGPIVRYIDVERELGQRDYDVDKVFKGVVRFSFGLAKKIVISNTVGQLADTIFNGFSTTGQMSAATGWLGAIAYTLQIYFDFSGYSDMAIGLGHMMGFNFIENFNYPYISKTVQEFWRRWHMSLSTWFRDYLYIPLGGNRKGKLRTYINLFIVFACTGFWHGAAWNFLVWGLFHGFFQILERLGLGKLIKETPEGIQRVPVFSRIYRIFMDTVGHIYTLWVAVIGWVLFRAESLTAAWNYVVKMYDFSNFGFAEAVAKLDGYKIIILLLGIVASIPILPWLKKQISKLSWGETALSVAGAVAMPALMLVSVYCLTGSDYNPFIYFRF